MPFNKKTHFGGSLNILESEEGLVTKTREALQSMAKEEDGRKVIKAGALFANPDDATDIGVVFNDYDMTDYEKFPISVVFQGRLRKDRVAAEAVDKKEDFAKQGLYLV